MSSPVELADCCFVFYYFIFHAMGTCFTSVFTFLRFETCCAPQVRNEASHMCLDAEGMMSAKDRYVKNYFCHGLGGHQVAQGHDYSFCIHFNGQSHFEFFFFFALFLRPSALQSCVMGCTAWIHPKWVDPTP